MQKIPVQEHYLYINSINGRRVASATTSDDNLIGLNTFNNSSDIVAPEQMYNPANII